MSWKDTDDVLHIVGQMSWHDDAFIIGTREGLTRLRNAIDLALENPGKAHSAVEMCSDGEGYYAVVRCVPGDKMDEAPLGYTEDYCRDTRKWPSWVTQGIDGSAPV